MSFSSAGDRLPQIALFAFLLFNHPNRSCAMVNIAFPQRLSSIPVLRLFLTLHSPCVIFSYCTNRPIYPKTMVATPTSILSTLWCASCFPH